jgi:glycerol-3-phosphate cytidylyltransferase-like family protein
MYTSPTIWHHNRYNAQTACEHCDGVIRHEPWCITLNSTVYYAYRIVAEPSALTFLDALILHALGVSWSRVACGGKCNRDC